MGAVVCDTNGSLGPDRYNDPMRMTMNISLPADLRKWVDKQVSTGGFTTASEYVRDMLRRERRRQMKREVESLILESMASGKMEEAGDGYWSDLRAQARKRLKAPRGRKTKA